MKPKKKKRLGKQIESTEKKKGCNTITQKNNNNKKSLKKKKKEHTHTKKKKSEEGKNRWASKQDDSLFLRWLCTSLFSFQRMQLSLPRLLCTL